MANAGPNTNGSQFFICFKDTPHLNEKHTIFGRVINNYEAVDLMENNPTGAQDKPLLQVTIVDSGELKGDDKLNATNADALPRYAVAGPSAGGMGMGGDDDEEESDEEAGGDDYGHEHGPGCSH